MKVSKNYIGVVGEAYYFEYPETWFIDIILNIQAAKKGDPILAKAGEYKNKLIKFLIDEGIPKKQLFYAGTDAYTPWWKLEKKDKKGIIVSHKVTIRTGDRYKAYKALEKAEWLNKKDKRISIRIDERTPIFKSKAKDILKARELACKNALEKAESLAASLGMKVGKPLEIQEFAKESMGAGNYGDNDWSTIRCYAPSRGGSDDDINIELKGNERIVYLKYSVNFELIPS
ncbi:MAG: hypothetical protein A2X54_06675 [Nitrospirae bacterium GWF2_44_13]|nr:MAG: hypothetical protein A2X54_06675 [Nitrospirae bacterium GWF2_44_13]OGW63859.1 MAG: hypothetical protein A2222_08130 [Nitrospirae bacterium RIFOXYA2_FULL_44_9]OGW72013.1 MAG: hypothetical protein A2484_07250 [Nitrospirae bacterium RIFOXYC2_FULL_44_7]